MKRGYLPLWQVSSLFFGRAIRALTGYPSDLPPAFRPDFRADFPSGFHPNFGPNFPSGFSSGAARQRILRMISPPRRIASSLAGSIFHARSGSDFFRPIITFSISTTGHTFR